MNYTDKLLKLLDNSYAPYSKFNVASIVVDVNGNEYEGVNVENAVFGATQCAERNAINTAVTQGMKKGELKEVHIIARNNNGETIDASPCGICRQVILEQSEGNAKVYLYNENGLVSEHEIKDLLPEAFTGEEL